MGVYIGITKYKEEDNIHYYFVNPEEHRKPNFYIGIDPVKNLVRLYWDKKFENCFGEIDFNDLYKKLKIENVNPTVLYAVVTITSKALKNKKFPNSMSYCA